MSERDPKADPADETAATELMPKQAVPAADLRPWSEKLKDETAQELAVREAFPAAPAPPAATTATFWRLSADELEPAPESTAVIEVVQAVLPAATISGVRAVRRPQVFQVLWRGHQAQAAASDDLAMVATAAVLIDAAERLPAGALAAGVATVNDKRHAVFVDTERKLLLAVVAPAEVFLAGT